MIAEPTNRTSNSILHAPPASRKRDEGAQWVNPLEEASWDEQLDCQRHPEYTFFHSTAWAKILAKTYGYKPIYFVRKESGMVRSVLPFMEVNSGLTGKRGVSLPFTDVCEPLCTHRAGFNELLRNATELAQARRWRYLEFHGGENLLNEASPSVSFYRHIVDIPPDDEALFAKIKSSVRRAIRKAEDSGVAVEFRRDLGAVKAYYLLHGKSRKKHGMPPQPFSFFKNIHEHILSGGFGLVALAHWNGLPIAGAIFFYTERKAIYKFGASDERFQHLRGNNLVFREAMRWFGQKGITTLDLGRTSMNNEGLRRFKSGWNASEKRIGYFRFCPWQKSFLQMPDRSSGWHNFIFRALPGPASRIAGEFLYRHWA